MAIIETGEGAVWPIQNRIITIYGKPGTGKTFISVLLASVHKRIYSNVIIKRHGKVVSNTIQNIDDIEKIQFSNVKGIVILDEGGINVNARRSSSEQNMEFWKLGMLGRKKNVNIVVISQLERMTDVYFRELASGSITMHSWFVPGGKMMFEATFRNDFWNIEGSKFVDLFKWAEKSGYTYDSLESSKIEKSKRYALQNVLEL